MSTHDCRLEHVDLVRAVCDRFTRLDGGPGGCRWVGPVRWSEHEAEGDALEHASLHAMADARAAAGL